MNKESLPPTIEQGDLGSDSVQPQPLIPPSGSPQERLDKIKELEADRPRFLFHPTRDKRIVAKGDFHVDRTDLGVGVTAFIRAGDEIPAELLAFVSEDQIEERDQ